MFPYTPNKPPRPYTHTGEIGRKPMSDRIQDRESYTLSAGLALGMVALGLGGSPGLSDLKLEDRLHRYGRRVCCWVGRVA